MIDKVITFCGQRARVGCDEKCEKAWGTNSRPRIEFDPDERDDYAYLSDDELGLAPVDPGTSEGGHNKPTSAAHRANRWCIRECERMAMSMPGESDKPLVLRDFSKRVYNFPEREEREKAEAT